MIPQTDWQQTIDESPYTLTGFLDAFEFNYSSLRAWLDCKHTPREKNINRMEIALSKIQLEKKIPFHKSFGYATEEQVQKLNSLGLGPDRDHVLKEIARQNETKGKTKY